MRGPQTRDSLSSPNIRRGSSWSQLPGQLTSTSPWPKKQVNKLPLFCPFYLMEFPPQNLKKSPAFPPFLPFFPLFSSCFCSGITPAQLALSWCKSRWYVPSTIIGATTFEQLKENIGNLGFFLFFFFFWVTEDQIECFFGFQMLLRLNFQRKF